VKLVGNIGNTYKNRQLWYKFYSWKWWRQLQRRLLPRAPLGLKMIFLDLAAFIRKLLLCVVAVRMLQERRTCGRIYYWWTQVQQSWVCYSCPVYRTALDIWL